MTNFAHVSDIYRVDEVLARTFNMVLSIPCYHLVDMADMDCTAFCKCSADLLHAHTNHSIDADLHFVGHSARSSLPVHTTILLANF